MNWEAIGSAGEVIGAVAVFLTLLYLARQIRDNTRALSAQSRHSLSDFARELSQFRAQHADRFAHIESGEPLSPGDLEFRFWSHMQTTLYAETYFRQHELGLMPEHHWSGFSEFFKNYTASPGFAEFWEATGYAFSEHFRNWLNESIDGKKAAAAPVAG
jgi:hypothetical protein